MDIEKKYKIAELEFLVNERQIEFAFVAGSIYEGYGNCESDLDIYVICDSYNEIKNIKTTGINEIMTHKKNYFIHWYNEDSLKYDIEYHEVKKLSKAINSLNRIKVTNRGEINPIDEDLFELLHRFKCSYPIRGKDKYEYLHNKMNCDNLSIQLAVLKKHKYHGIIEDINGALNAGDFGTAYCAIRKAVDTIMTSYLACFDYTNPNDKWIYKKMVDYCENTKDYEILDCYKKIISLPFAENLIAKHIEYMIDECELYNTYIENWINSRKCG